MDYTLLNVGEEPKGWTDDQKFQYWFKRASELYDTRFDPFQDSKEIVWYIERLELYINNYTFYKNKQIIENNETLKLTEVMFLTYNPKPDTPLKTAIKSVNDFLQKQKITDYIYVIEQRGISEETMGDFHIHILHKHKYDRVSHYKRETQSSFRKTCNVQHYACLNFQPCFTDQDVKKRLNYILHEKSDEDGLNKSAKQLIDKVYRKKYNLKDYYTNDFTLWESYF